MSKNRNNVKYSLFTSDPVPLNKNLGSKNITLFIKGDKNVTFELKKGHDNIYIIKHSDGKKFEFDRNFFLSTLRDLKKYSHNPIKILDDEQNNNFDNMMSSIEMLRKTGKLYELLHNDIATIFDDVKIVIPGTVAAYFIGCSSKDDFPGPMGCNPRCAASLTPGGKDSKDYTCNDLVLMYEDDKTFSSMNKKISQHSYIHIGDVNFKGFTSDNIKQLSDAHISSATLIYARIDGTYGNINQFVPVNDLPVESQTQNTTTNNDDAAAWILFIVIISIIIILLLIVLSQLYANRIV